MSEVDWNAISDSCSILNDVDYDNFVKIQISNQKVMKKSGKWLLKWKESWILWQPTLVEAMMTHDLFHVMKSFTVLIQILIRGRYRKRIGVTFWMNWMGIQRWEHRDKSAGMVTKGREHGDGSAKMGPRGRQHGDGTVGM